MTATMQRAELTQLREKRHDAFEAMQAINALQMTENRALTAEETRQYGEYETAVDRMDAQIAEHVDVATTAGFIPVDGAAVHRDGRIEGRDGEVLGRETRVADWTTKRNMALGRASFGENEAAEFRFGRLVAGMVTGNWKGAELERRAYAEGGDSTGGFAVPEILSGPVIDNLRNVAQVTKAGARTIMLGANNHSIPRLSASATGTWRAESSKVNESAGAFDRITFRTRTLAVLARISYELSEDVIDGAAALITDDLTRSLALKLDYGCLRGSGQADPIVAAGGVAGDEPLGVRNQPGVEILSTGADGQATDSYQAIVAAAGHIRSRNLEPNAAIMSARSQEDLGGLVDTTGQPISVPRYLDRVPFLPTNQVRDDLTQGTSDDASEIYVGDWSQLWIGVRPVIGVRVQQLTEKFADTMEYGILAWLRADVQLAHPEGFTVVTGVRPSADSSAFTSTIN